MAQVKACVPCFSSQLGGGIPSLLMPIFLCKNGVAPQVCPISILFQWKEHYLIASSKFCNLSYQLPKSSQIVHMRPNNTLKCTKWTSSVRSQTCVIPTRSSMKPLDPLAPSISAHNNESIGIILVNPFVMGWERTLWRIYFCIWLT